MMPCRSPGSTVGAAAMVALAAFVLVSAPRVKAQESVLDTTAIRSNELVTTFAEALSFRLEASTPNPAAAAILRYRLDDGDAVQRRRAVVGAGSPGSVILEYHEDLSRGQIPPASDIQWWWTLEFADGNTSVSAPATVTYLDQHFEWRASEADAVRVWTYGPKDDLERRVAEAATSGLDRAVDLTGVRPDGVIDIVTYRTRTDMLPALVARGDAYEERLATLGARVAPDIVLLLAEPGYRDIANILAHELSHVVLHLRFEESYVDAPLWLDEGLAMVSEGDLAGDDQRILDQSIRSDDLMSLRSLTSFPGRAELVPLAYAESHDIVSFLMKEKGPDTFRAFLDDLGRGEMTVDEALTAHYAGDQLGLYQEYRAARGLAPAEPPVADPAEAAHQTTGSAPPCLGALAMPLLVGFPAFARRRRIGVPGRSTGGALEGPAP